MEDKNNTFFWKGAIIGLLGGIAGNIFVTAMYRIIDNIPAGKNVETFLTALISFAVIIGLMFYASKQNKTKYIKKNVFTSPMKQKSGKIIEDFIKKYKNVIKTILITILIVSILLGFVIYYNTIDKVFDFLIKLAAFSIALAGVSAATGNLIKKNEANSNTYDNRAGTDVINYRLLAEKLTKSGVFFVFTYFFLIVYDFMSKASLGWLKGIAPIFSLAAVLGLGFGLGNLVIGMWELLGKNE